MKAYCLASSSSGNCYIIECGNSRLLIECGLPYREILRKCNNERIDFSNICACLVTHAHGDHSRSIRDLIKVGIPVYASSGTYEELKMNPDHVLEDLKPTQINSDFKVMSFPVEHDINGAVGFVIKTSEKETIMFINDHKRWTQNLTAFKPNYLFIECNYDHSVVYPQLYALNKTKKNDSLTEEELKEVNIEIKQHERNINAHCSLHGTIKGCKKLDLSQCRTIFLMHLSDRYANEYKMKNEVQDATRIKTVVCGKRGGIK